METKGDFAVTEELTTWIHAIDEVAQVDESPSPIFEVQQAEKARETVDALTQLADQIPQPHPVPSVKAETSLQDLALLTREFNRAMGLPEGASMKIVTAERGQEYGRMLYEDVREIEERSHLEYRKMSWQS